LKLTEFGCGSNQLTELDVSKNSALRILNCDFNQLSKLDVTNNAMLVVLSFYSNNITEIDLSNCLNLQNIYCSGNDLKSLNVSKNKDLRSLLCRGNKLETLDISQNPELDDLNCSNNALTSLDVSNNPKLTQLMCYHNHLTSLDITALAKIWTIECGNQISLDETESQILLLTLLDSQESTWKTHKETLWYTDINDNVEIDVVSPIPFMAKATGVSISLSGHFLNISGLASKGTVRIFDFKGRLLVSTQSKNGTARIALQHPGTYVMQAPNVQQTFVIR